MTVSRPKNNTIPMPQEKSAKADKSQGKATELDTVVSEIKYEDNYQYYSSPKDRYFDSIKQLWSKYQGLPAEAVDGFDEPLAPIPSYESQANCISPKAYVHRLEKIKDVYQKLKANLLHGLKSGISGENRSAKISKMLKRLKEVNGKLILIEKEKINAKVSSRNQKYMDDRYERLYGDDDE